MINNPQHETSIPTSNEIERQASVAEKLAGVARYGFSVIPETFETGGRKRLPNDFYTVTSWPRPETPLKPGLRFYAEKGSNEILIWEVALGDEELEGHGLGSLMIAQTVQYHEAYLKSPPSRTRRFTGKPSKRTTPVQPLTIRRQRGNLPFMRALDKVAGRENISFLKDGRRYGRGQKLPFEAVIGRNAIVNFSQEPLSEEEFSVHDVQALVIPERFTSIDIPARLQQIAAMAQERLVSMQRVKEAPSEQPAHAA